MLVYDRDGENSRATIIDKMLRFLCIMLSTMPAKPPFSTPARFKLIKGLGERLRDARLRRRFSVSLVAQRADVPARPSTRLSKAILRSPQVPIYEFLQCLASKKTSLR